MNKSSTLRVRTVQRSLPESIAKRHFAILIRPGVAIHRRNITRAIIRVRGVRSVVQVRKVGENSRVVRVRVRSEPDLVTNGAGGVGLDVVERVGNHGLGHGSGGGDGGLLVGGAGGVGLTLDGGGARGGGFACDRKGVGLDSGGGEEGWLVGVGVDEEELVAACQGIKSLTGGCKVVGFAD